MWDLRGLAHGAHSNPTVGLTWDLCGVAPGIYVGPTWASPWWPTWPVQIPRKSHVGLSWAGPCQLRMGWASSSPQWPIKIPREYLTWDYHGLAHANCGWDGPANPVIGPVRACPIKSRTGPGCDRYLVICARFSPMGIPYYAQYRIWPGTLVLNRIRPGTLGMASQIPYRTRTGSLSVL